VSCETEEPSYFLLRKQLTRIGLPTSISLELTYRCQLRCSHCYIVDDDPRRHEISPEAWLQLIEEAAEIGTVLLLITGGEPTLYPGFWELLEEINKYHFLVRLFTNAYDLDEKGVDRLVRANVRFVEVSLHGADAATQDAISGVPGSFDRIVHSLRLLRAAGIFVKIKTSLMQQNYSSFTTLERFGAALGSRFAVSALLTPDNNNDPSVQRDQLTGAQLMELEQQRSRWNTMPVTCKFKHSFKTAIPCGAGITSLSVCPNGDVLPCLQTRMTLGNATRTSLRRIWLHASRLVYWRGISDLVYPECRECGYQYYCNRCPGIAHLETGSAWKPSATLCQQAKNNAEANSLLESSSKRSPDEEEISEAASQEQSSL
jgi:radical SAM protein with 4Fe4S-binding SPASM domain